MPAHSPEYGPSIGLRLAQAEYLMHALETIMDDRLGFVTNMNNHIAFQIERALEPLGLQIKIQSLSPAKRAEIFQLSSSQEDVWHRSSDIKKEETSLFPSGEEYGHYLESPIFRAPSKKTQPEELAQFKQVARELTIPTEQWDDERMLGFVNLLIESRELLAKFQEGEIAPGAPGLIPPVAQRLHTGTEVMQVVVALLEAGYNEKKLDQAFVKEHLNKALTANYGIKVIETSSV